MLRKAALALKQKKYNERLKLSASSLNTIALTVFGLGMARPLVSSFIDPEGTFDPYVYVDVKFLVIGIVAFVLHLMARGLLHLLLEE